MKIHIFGAAGSGTTTQGIALAKVLGVPYFDSDTYFWEDTVIPFTVRRIPLLRNQLLEADVSGLAGYVIGGGSLPNWNEQWLDAFDLVVFLYLSAKVRLNRLRQRELERYGNVIFDHPDRNRLYTAFMDWCSGYDDSTASGRTLKVHEEWIKKYNCPVLIIDEDLDTEQKTGKILLSLRKAHSNLR